MKSIIRICRKFSLILSEHQLKRIVELIILMVIGGILEMCSVSIVLPFMNIVMNPNETMEKWYAKIICSIFDLDDSSSFLILVSIALAVIYILKNAYLIFEFNIQYGFVYRNMFDLQKRLLDNYIHRPYEYFLNVNSADIIRIVNSDTVSAFSLLSTLLAIFTEMVVSCILIVTIFAVTPIVTIGMAVVLLILVVVINKFVKPVLRRAGLKTQSSLSGMNKWLLQSIQGIKEVKIMGREEYFQGNFDKYGYDYVEAQRKNAVLSNIPRFLIEAVSMSAMFVLVAALIYKGQALENVVPMLTAVAVAAIRLLPSVNRISNSLGVIAYNEPMLDKLLENLKDMESYKKCEHDSDKHSVADKEEGFLSKSSGIIVRDIRYHYPDTERYVLDTAGMVIKFGESVGIIGESGAGKTTAVDIFLALLNPQSGGVYIGDEDVRDHIKEWHESIGYIPQMIFMLDDSIRSNVAFGVDEADIVDEDVWSALREASLYEFVMSLPKQLDTEIGERGVRLSGGQRQRIGIARALYRNPRILVFDEATSALDNETEAAIMESINGLHGQKTMIIIAHRLTTIEQCDHIFRVSGGKIETVR